MIGKILGGIAGKQIADHTSGVSGTTGIVAGALAGSILRRASIPALIAVTAGGYAFKKYKERKDAEASRRASFETPPKVKSSAT